MSDICKKKNIYFVTGGGTGGHIYPAIAVCEALKNDFQTKDIYYIGNPDNMEYEIVKNLGFKFLPVGVSGMPRKLSFKLIKWFVDLEIATCKAVYYIHKYKPDAILGTGGYVSAPALFAANMTGIPFMIHDCDAKVGLVSKYVAPMAKAVSLAFEEGAKQIKSNNIHINGNPIRKEFKTMTKEVARASLGIKNKTTICVMGGSQGAKTINRAFIGTLRKLLENHDVQVIFQTGSKNYDDSIYLLEKTYPEYKDNKNLMVKPFFDNMSTVLKSADIAISRAGSLSLSEICASAIAPILVPYPYAAADHQRKNAKALLAKNACVYLEDKDTNENSLYNILNDLLINPDKMKQLQQNTEILAKYDSVELIMEQLKEIVK